MILDDSMADKSPSKADGSNDPSSRIEAGGSGRQRWWAVGGDRMELPPVGAFWTARVRREGWGDMAFEVDGRFGDEVEAVAWCEKMAEVLADDLDDEGDQ
jgi:hypothetical protein